MLRLIAIVGVVLLAVLTTPHILSALSLKSMALSGSFLGLVACGQTLCVLLGGFDLSIPFVIDASNVGTLWLVDHHVPSGLAVVGMLVFASLFGMVNGIVSSVIPGSSVVVSLGMGYVFLGLVEVVASIGSSTNGAVFGIVPKWISEMGGLNVKPFGLPVPPAFLLLCACLVIISVVLRATWHGRGVYAVGGNKVAARRVLVPERRIWMGAFAASACLSAIVGVLILGFSGGAVASVGTQYLFLTVAAVAVGGSSLAGGYGNVEFTLVGVVVLTVLASVLVASNLSSAMQQVLLGIIIVPAVGMYGRGVRIRDRV